MTGPRRLRMILNWINLTTLVGLLVAVLGRTAIRRGPDGLLVASGYRLAVPRQRCFTVGNVIVTRRSADWLLADEQADLFRHESRHATQYAFLGLLFFPLYLLASAWSWLLTGGYGARNLFEQHAGLQAGGYAGTPLRGWVARLAARFAGSR
ncbi:MAG: hypothetical protein ACRDUA_05470 [Micromonosporaceae bacterium]